MGEPIDVGDIEVGDILRVVNPMKESTFTVREITPREDGFRFIMGDPIPPATRLIPGIFGGRPGQGPEAYNQFFLVDRPRKNARALAELSATKTQIPHAIIRQTIAPMLGLTERAGRGRRRKTRRRYAKRRGVLVS